MSSSFDPYHAWLGIPAEEQPANHYRLLGLPLYEPNRDVVENAVQQRVAHVRTYQSGKYSAQSQEILNHLSRARVCLLDGKQKEAYDSQLRLGTAVIELDPLTPAADLISQPLDSRRPLAEGESLPPSPAALPAPAGAPPGEISFQFTPALWIGFSVFTAGGALVIAVVAWGSWFFGSSSPPPDVDPSPAVAAGPGPAAAPRPTGDPTSPSNLRRSGIQNHVGKEFAWQGTLQHVRRYLGEVRVLVRLDNEGIMLEAVAPGNFFDQVADYYDLISDRKPERVMLTAKVASEQKHPPYCLSTDSLMLTLISLERPGAPGSRAVVGHKRPASSFDTSRVRAWKAALFRDLADPGVPATLETTWSGYQSGERPSFTTHDGKGSRVQFSFVNLPPKLFGDYEQDDKVIVKANIIPSKATSLAVKVEAESVQRRDDPDSLVTRMGRKKEPPSFQHDYDRLTAAGAREAASGTEFVLGGKLGNRAAKGAPLVSISSVMLDQPKSSHLSLLTLGDEGSEAFFSQLRPGETLYFGVRLVPLVKAPQPALLWMSRPDGSNKRTFLQPAPRSPPTDEAAFQQELAGSWEGGKVFDHLVYFTFRGDRLEASVLWEDRVPPMPTESLPYSMSLKDRTVRCAGPLVITWLEPRFLVASGTILIKDRRVTLDSILRRVPNNEPLRGPAKLWDW